MAVIKMKKDGKWERVFCGTNLGENTIDIIVDVTSGDKIIEISSLYKNLEYRYLYASGITSLTLNPSSDLFTNDTELYYSIDFISGTTPTQINNNLNVYFKGDDCLNGIFTPMATKNYEIGIWWNGIGWNAVVRG